MNKITTRKAHPGRRCSNRHRAGIVIPFLVVMIGAICGIVGLAVDTGRLFFEKRMLQAAADAGAIGGSRELIRGNKSFSEVETAAVHDAELNGAEEETITVSYPPSSGTYAGNANFVEVLIEKDVPTTFTRVVGPEGATVRVRAVAGIVNAVDFCILALNRVNTRALYVRGSGVLEMDCGAMSNSGSPSGLVTSGSLFFKAKSIAVSGGYVDEGTSSGYVDPYPVERVAPVTDPLALIPSVDYTGWAPGYYNEATGTYVCPGGRCVWSSQIIIEGKPVLRAFESGIHVLLNGMRIASGVTVDAYQTMFYVAGGNIEMEGSATLNQTPAPAGTYRGIVVFMSRSLPGGFTSFGAGQSTYNFRGAMYAPTRHLLVAGGALGNDPWAMYIADEVEYAGSSALYLIEPPEDERPDVSRVTLVQ